MTYSAKSCLCMGGRCTQLWPKAITGGNWTRKVKYSNRFISIFSIFKLAAELIVWQNSLGLAKTMHYWPPSGWNLIRISLKFLYSSPQENPILLYSQKFSPVSPPTDALYSNRQPTNISSYTVALQITVVLYVRFIDIYAFRSEH